MCSFHIRPDLDPEIKTPLYAKLIASEAADTSVISIISFISNSF